MLLYPWQDDIGQYYETGSSTNIATQTYFKKRMIISQSVHSYIYLLLLAIDSCVDTMSFS